MARLTIQIPDDAGAALADESIRRFRDPREQAAYVVVEWLRGTGALPKEERSSDSQQPPRGPEAA